jgi:hypothetical protein
VRSADAEAGVRLAGAGLVCRVRAVAHPRDAAPTARAKTRNKVAEQGIEAPAKSRWEANGAKALLPA